MIKTVIFDMGNVLLTFDKNFFLDRAGVFGEDRKALQHAVFDSVEWVRLDRGSLDEAEAEARMCARLPEHLHKAVHELVYHWDEPIHPMPGMAELVAALKEKGYGLYLLSNAARRQHEYWPRIPGSEQFDATLISADEGLLKPEHEIYELLLQRYDLKADECVFIDDNPSNCEAAERLGIRSVVFYGDAALLRSELKRLGVNV